MKMVIVMHVFIMNIKIKLIGILERKNLEKCYLNSEKMMDLMIVLYQGGR